MRRTVDTRPNRLKDLLMNEKRRLWNELRTEILEKTGQNLNKQYDFPLDNALLKLNNNSYGICDSCGKEIDEARLQIFPYAAFCTVCQQQEVSGKRSASY